MKQLNVPAEISKILGKYRQQALTEGLPSWQNKSDDEALVDLTSLIEREKAETAKAYGGCTKCYGKGYATVSDRWVGHDTDQDIGSPGGTIRGGKDFAMKFCTCDRGKQLAALTV